MDKKQVTAVKKCYNAVNALTQERKELNAQVKEEYRITAAETGWDVKILKDGFSLYKKGVPLDTIQELYEVFDRMDNSFENGE